MPTNNTSKSDLGQTLQRLENKFGFSVSSSEELLDSREVRRLKRVETPPPPRLNDLRASDESSIQDFIKNIRKKYLNIPETEPIDNYQYKSNRVLSYKPLEETHTLESQTNEEPLIDLSSQKREPLDLLTPVNNLDVLAGLKFSPPRNTKHAHSYSLPIPTIPQDQNIPDLYTNNISLSKNEVLDSRLADVTTAKPVQSPTKKGVDIHSLRHKRRLYKKKTPLQILIDSPEKNDRDDRFEKPLKSPSNIRPVQSSPNMKSIPSHLENILNATISDIIIERLNLRPICNSQMSVKTVLPRSPTKTIQSYNYQGKSSPEKNKEPKLNTFDEYLQSHPTQSLKNKFSPLKTTPIKKKVDMNKIFETDPELLALLRREKNVLSRISSIEYEIKQIKTKERQDSLI